MSKQIINLTLQIVSEEIESVLENYPEYPYHQAFAPSNLRLELIAYVLSRIPNIYKVVEETQEPSINTMFPSVSSEQRLQLESWIHIGIRDVLHMNLDLSL